MNIIRSALWLLAAALISLAIPAALVAIPVFIFIFVAGMLLHSPACEQRAMLSQIISADGAWVVTTYHNICSDGGFFTNIDDTVELARPGDPRTPFPSTGTVFAMNSIQIATPLAAKWSNARKLEITIPNDAWAGQQEVTFADVTISYKYVPDDPIERACLKQWRALSTDEMIRRNDSSTENMKMFLAKCHAGGSPH